MIETVFVNRVVQVVIKDECRDKLYYQVFINGDRGIIYGLTGKLGLIDLDHLRKLFEYTHCEYFEADMADVAFAQLMKILPAEIAAEPLKTYTDIDGTKLTRTKLTLPDRHGI